MKLCAEPDLCFFGKFPTLEMLKRAYGNNAAAYWLIPQLNNLSEFCGQKDKLTGIPLEETAWMISNEFFYMKVSEIMLFFYRFKSGRYGRFYGSIDPLIIMTALKEFANERIMAYNRREQKLRERQEEESRKNAISWEEYCKRNGIEGRKSPFDYK